MDPKRGGVKKENWNLVTRNSALGVPFGVAQLSPSGTAIGKNVVREISYPAKLSIIPSPT